MIDEIFDGLIVDPSVKKIDGSKLMIGNFPYRNIIVCKQQRCDNDVYESIGGASTYLEAYRKCIKYIITKMGGAYERSTFQGDGYGFIFYFEDFKEDINYNSPHWNEYQAW